MIPGPDRAEAYEGSPYANSGILHPDDPVIAAQEAAFEEAVYINTKPSYLITNGRQERARRLREVSMEVASIVNTELAARPRTEE